MKKLWLSESAVCALSLFADCFLSVMKLIGGWLANSSALFSDGVHSGADTFASLFTLFGVLGKKKGREKAEKITLRFICFTLTVTGVAMMISSLKNIIGGSEDIIPDLSALAVSVLSLSVKEALFFYTRYASKKTGSAILYAQAWHHQSDALSCVGSFIGILGALLGAPALDDAAGIIISVMIIKTAFDIARGKT